MRLHIIVLCEIKQIFNVNDAFLHTYRAEDGFY